jgi:hypothetical protein
MKIQGVAQTEKLYKKKNLKKMKNLGFIFNYFFLKKKIVLFFCLVII